MWNVRFCFVSSFGGVCKRVVCRRAVVLAAIAYNFCSLFSLVDRDPLPETFANELTALVQGRLVISGHLFQV